MKFVVDCMLGKLAKWLKILGFDALFFPVVEDEKLLDLALAERRMLLTRDTRLLEKARFIQTLFIESEHWRDQVRQVLEAFNLRAMADPFSRCIDCNIRLKDLPKEKAKNLVTPFVYAQAEIFALCPECGRVFWKGTHHKDMERKIADILQHR